MEVEAQVAVTDRLQGKKRVFPRPCRGSRAVSTLILDFSPSELWENKLSHEMCMATPINKCYLLFICAIHPPITQPAMHHLPIQSTWLLSWTSPLC